MENKLNHQKNHYLSPSNKCMKQNCQQLLNVFQKAIKENKQCIFVYILTANNKQESSAIHVSSESLKHNQCFLAVDDVKMGKIQKLRYWPIGMKYRKIFEFITQHQSYISSTVQDINKNFNVIIETNQGMAMRILSQIDKMRLQILKKIDNFYLKQTAKKKFTQQVTYDLHKCFQLKIIRQIVRQFFIKEIRHKVFLKMMNDALNDKQYVQILLQLLQLSRRQTYNILTTKFLLSKKIHTLIEYENFTLYSIFLRRM